MANAKYIYGKQGILDQSIDWLGDDFRVALIGAGYVANVSTDVYLSSVGALNILGISSILTAKSAALGRASCDPTSVPSLGGIVQVTQAVLYQDTGSAATSRLVIYYDTSIGSITLPFLPNGQNVNISWPSGYIWS